MDSRTELIKKGLKSLKDRDDEELVIAIGLGDPLSGDQRLILRMYGFTPTPVSFKNEREIEHNYFFTYNSRPIGFVYDLGDFLVAIAVGTIKIDNRVIKVNSMIKRIVNSMISAEIKWNCIELR